MITIVTGPPCAGKSTHVKANAGPTDVVIDFDALAQAFGNLTPHAAKGAQRDVAQTARRAAIERVLSGLSADAWIIHTWPTASQLETYKAADALLVELDPGIDEALARASFSERPEGTDQAIRSWYEKREGKSMQEHRVKSFMQVAFKAAGEDPGDGTKLGPGEFIATASVLGNVDRYGETIMPGAFTETLAEWAASGDPIPVIWQHNWADPFAHVGVVKSIGEVDGAIQYRGLLDLDDPYASKVYKLMKGRRVTKQSFGFDVLEGGMATHDGEDIYEIRKLKLFEVGPCLVGVNDATELLDIKSSSTDGPAGAPALAAESVEQPSGQAKPGAADNPSEEPASKQEESASAKGMSPASVMLALEIIETEGE